MKFGKALRKIAVDINKHVYNNALDMSIVKIRTCDKFIEGFAVGMCEWNNTKGKIILTFSKEIPADWVADFWTKYAPGLVAHEMAHAIQFLGHDKHLTKSHKKNYNVHDSKLFKVLGNTFAKKTGIDVKYFGLNGEIE